MWCIRYIINCYFTVIGTGDLLWSQVMVYIIVYSKININIVVFYLQNILINDGWNMDT